MELKNRLFLIFLILMIILSVSVVCATENTTVEQTDELEPLSAVETPTEIDTSPEIDESSNISNRESLTVDESTNGQHQNNVLKASNEGETPLKAGTLDSVHASDYYSGGTFSELQSIINKVKSGGTVFLDGLTFTGTTEVTLGWSMTIYGGHTVDDGLMATLNGQNKTRVLYCHGSYSINLYNLKIKDGKSGTKSLPSGSPFATYKQPITSIGAGILLQVSNARLSNIEFDHCGSTADSYGGACRIMVLNNLSIENCKFNNNYLHSGGGAALRTDGPGTIINCSFYNNINQGAGNCSAAGGLQSAAQKENGQNIQSGILTIINCYFENNTNINNIRYNNAHGGALCMLSPGITCSNSTFINNKANQGGATQLHTDGTLVNCTFINNTATTLYGGAINTGLDANDITVNIIDCTFEGNQAPIGGAVQLKGNDIHIANSTFNNNSAIQGGACYIQGQRAIIENSTFNENKATHNINPEIKPSYSQININANSEENGGAVYIGRVDSKTTSDNAKIYTSIFEENNAKNGAGVFIEGRYANIQNNTFEDNTAVNGAGAYINGRDATVQNNTFDSNTATEGAGTYINGLNTIIQENTFEDNTAVNGAGAYVKSTGATSTTNTKVISNNFTGNNVTGKGGACYIEGNYPRFTDNYFEYNNAIPRNDTQNVGLGGAVYVKGSYTVTDSNSYRFNTARNGSAIYTDGMGFNLMHDKFFKNQAYSYFLVTTAEPEDSIYKTSDVLVTVVHVGGDNILNAIHNTQSFNQITFQDVTYVDFFGNNRTTGSEMTQPLDGPLNSANGTHVYQFDREAYQDVQIIITHEDGTVRYNDTLKTDIFGTVYVPLDKLSLQPGNYTVYAVHPEDWNYKFIDNSTTFRVDPIPVTPGKTVSNSTPNINDIIEYNLTVVNTADAVYSDNITVIDSLPDGLEYIVGSAIITGADGVSEPIIDNNKLIWTIKNIQGLSTATITIQVKVTKVGDLTNNETIVDHEGREQTVNCTVHVNPIVDLSIIKTSDKDQYDVGDIVTWTIVVSNAANGTNATNVAINDLMPTAFEIINCTDLTGNPLQYNNGKVNIGKMANGTDYTIVIKTYAKAVGEYTNIVTVNCTEDEWNTNNNKANKTVDIIDMPPVKTVTIIDPYYGQIILYNLTVYNNGTYTYTKAVIMEDTLPEGLEYVSTVALINATGNKNPVITNNGKKLTWNITNIAPKATATITIQVKVTKVGDLTNNLTVTHDGHNQTVNRTVTVKPYVDLTINKTSDKDQYDVGDIVTWTIVVSNAANGTNATNVAINDLMPTAFEIINCTDLAGNPLQYNNGKVNIGKMANGTDYTIVIKTYAKAVGEYTNIVTVNCTEDEWNTNNNKANKTVDIIDMPPVKTVSNPTPYIGDVIEYYLTVDYNGTKLYTKEVNIFDVLPVGLELVEQDAVRFSNNFRLVSQNIDGKKLSWTITDIAPNTTAIITVKVRVTNIGVINNTINVTHDGHSQIVNCSIDPIPLADLGVVKLVSVKTAHKGDKVIWTIRVTNYGPCDAENVVVCDILPEELELIKAYLPEGTKYENGVWTIGNMANGTSLELILETVVNVTNKTIVNVVNVTSDTEDPNPDNNNDTNSTDVPPEADLEVIKLVSIQTVHKGDKVIWTIIIRNLGPDTAVNAILSDVLPNGLKLIKYSASVGTYANGLWTIGDLASGASANLTIETEVTTSNAVIINIANATSDTYDPDTSNNNGSNKTVVPPQADLIIIKTPSVISAKVGDKITYAISVINRGPDTAVNARAFDILPKGLKLISFKVSKGTFDPATGKWMIGDLAPGEKVTLLLVTEALISGQIINEATVESDTYDNDTSNNYDNATVNVTEVPEEPEVPSVPKMHPTGNPLAMVLLALLVLGTTIFRRKI